jgi:tRNA threonylcarbamoyl adenosine modification protein YeaZ
MRVLGLDSSFGGCAACILGSDGVLAEEEVRAGQGIAALLAPLVARLVVRAGLPDLAAVVVGPGSFTGLRAGLSVVLGLGAASGIPVVGVTSGEAWGGQVGSIGGRTLWTAIQARKDRVFIDAGQGFEAWRTDDVPASAKPVALAGMAANLVASILAARGTDVMLTAARRPRPADVAQTGLRRWRGELRPLEALPLYIDDPEARAQMQGTA